MDVRNLLVCAPVISEPVYRTIPSPPSLPPSLPPYLESSPKSSNQLGGQLLDKAHRVREEDGGEGALETGEGEAPGEGGRVSVSGWL